MRGVNTVRKASGAVYYYHRRTRTRLNGAPGSAEFMRAYAEAEASLVRKPGEDLAGLLRAFEKTQKWRSLADSTRIEYARIFRVLEDEFGTVPHEALQAKSFRQFVLKWRDAHAEKAPREADNRVTILARVLAWGANDGPLNVNVLAGIERIYSADRSDAIWLPEHIDAFMGTAPEALCHALMLALHTGQRQGDILRLSWRNYDGVNISLRQGKTRTPVIIPCTAALKDMLDGMERRQAVILTTPSGRPWKAMHFRHRWKAAMDAAGVSGLHFHDLRGTAVTMLAEAGCTNAEIAAITGHSLRYVGDILDKYLARTRTLAANAIAKLEARRKEKEG